MATVLDAAEGARRTVPASHLQVDLLEEESRCEQVSASARTVPAGWGQERTGQGDAVTGGIVVAFGCAPWLAVY